MNRRPAVLLRLDAARLFRLALEKGAAEGFYHGVAEVIGSRLNVPVASKTPAEASEHFGWFANFAAIDCPASSAQARARLGWQPTHDPPDLVADIDQSYYFEG